MHKVTLIQGDGIGPAIVAATLTVMEATGVKIAWEEAIAGEEALEKYGTPCRRRPWFRCRKIRSA